MCIKRTARQSAVGHDVLDRGCRKAPRREEVGRALDDLAPRLVLVLPWIPHGHPLSQYVLEHTMLLNIACAELRQLRSHMSELVSYERHNTVSTLIMDDGGMNLL